MKMINLYHDILKDIAKVFTGENYVNFEDCTLRIITPGGQQIFESKFNKQNFEADFSSFNHKGPCLI